MGWDLALLGLALHLLGGLDRPDDPIAFVRSVPAQRFIRATSERWGAASVNAGTAEEDATAATNRTTAFYLGEEPA